MVTNTRPRSAGAFGAIADPTRRAILDLLRTGDLCAGDLARQFPVSRPAIAKHVRILRSAGLLREHRRAQQRIYSLDPAALGEIDNWLAPYRLFWAARLTDLKQLLESTENRND
ncbi:metalloregulator ArsR/SmtB family transcription factor [Tahibacter soli]|jgi:DNA-binding transcriptional ArsR family regulator|uniref:Metalloregulator ArsR/SmtB family transcription factor n=1 Tax=Tahibacter soli TaxID=2983605 RepID=A0A9X4BHH5_9GAMM|nr:metalloregulator ArsR/SmtB family transcription factor [Tahibacter soli]MDC8012403.1 metalloregulator ArsR/SmtB family transcription factor [Tahibacter soli]